MLDYVPSGARRFGAYGVNIGRAFLIIPLLLLASPFDLASSELLQTAEPESGAHDPVKADAMQQRSDTRTRDPAVLSRLAAAQEVYPGRALEAYSRLASVLEKGSPGRVHALERGFRLALRDGNLDQAATFAALLDAEGHTEYRELLGEKRAVHDDALIPGGLAGFAVIANVKQGTPPEQFFANYARQVVANVCSNNCMGDHYTATIQSYFAAITELEGFGNRDGNRVTVVLSLNSNDERNRTLNVLKLLGLQLHTEKGQIRLDRGERQSQSKKQDILDALKIDDVEFEEALRAGKSFTFEIRDEYAEIYPSAKMWKDSFPKQQQRHFAMTLLRYPWMARLYVGMSTLDLRTMQALIGTSGLYWFAGHPADLLSLYGASFAVEGERASVPGGSAAGPIWSQLAGASTNHAREFYQALLDQKSPSLLAYYYALSNLDQRHQAFFTANLGRAKRFYALFATLPESQTLTGGAVADTSFSKLLRSVPIDDEGHVAFPGSPEIWRLARRNSFDEKHVAGAGENGSRTAPLDLEDEILLRLVATHYKSHSVTSGELDVFLAVAGIDAHRAKPLDEESAALLARHYGDCSPAYPYFADLSAIDASGFRSFFRLVDGIAGQPLLERQLEMGELNALIEWVVLARRRDTIDDAQAANLFARICAHLAAANDGAARTQTAIELAQAILTDCGHGAAGRWDDSLRNCLLGASADKGDQRRKDYEIVLDEQKAPSIDVVRSIVAEAEAALNPAAAPHPAVIAQDEVALPSVPLPAEVKVIGKEKDAILLYDPAPVRKLIEEWNQNAGSSAYNPAITQRLAFELLKAIEPQVTLALAAPVYAYFFRSSDRVMSGDPLLLRKHRYFNFVASGEEKGLLLDSEFVSNSTGLGSWMEGGFSQFGLASGFAAAAGWKQGGSGGSTVVAEEIAAIRSATWDRLLDTDLQLATLRILAAREWIVASAQNSERLISLSEETSGLLSLWRRADLLNGIEERDWQQVWASITLPDLFRLGGSYLRRYPSEPSPSPVTTQLRLTAAANQDARLDILGRIPNHVLGCSHPHLVSDAPYEEYERLILPIYLAERTAEFKLFLAYRAYNLGVQPADLPRAAERLAAKAFSASQMADYHDWRSLLSAYASITSDDLKNVLEQ